MKDELSLKRIVIISLVLSIVPWVLVKVNFFRPVFSYKGTIIDAVENYPVSLVEVGVGENLTYRLENGEFELVSGSELTTINYLPTVDFEKPSDSLSCQKKKTSFLKNEFICGAKVYPQVQTVVERSLSTRVSSPNMSLDQRRELKEKLWNYLSLETQKLWGDKGSFVGSLILYDTTSEKLKSNIVFYSGVQVSENLERMPYFETGTIEGPIVTIKATLTEASGASQVEDLHLVRENGFWKLLFTMSPSQVTDFNAKYAWVFKKKTL